MGTYSGTVTTGIILTNPTVQNPATVTATGSITNTGGDAVYGNNATAWTLSNAGTINATVNYSNGVNFVNGGLVINTASGLIIGPNGVRISGAVGTALNAGRIVSTNDAAIRLDNGGVVTNLAGTSGSAQITGALSGVFLSSNGGTVNNGASGFSSATISGGVYGVWSLNQAATVTNYGTIAGTGTIANGIHLANGGTVTNAAGGVVSGSNQGININNAAGLVDNSGTILGGSGAVQLFVGAVTNREDGIISGGGGVGIIGPGTLVNLGTILANGATGMGVVFNSGGSVQNGSSSVTDALITGASRGVQIYTGAGTVTNFATIAASITYVAAVYLHGGGSVTNQSSGVIGGGGYGIVVSNSGGVVVNLGAVTGTADTGVLLQAGGTVINSGSIQGGFSGINVSAGAGVVDNSGTIIGGYVGVRLVGTIGTLTNSGLISGGGGSVLFGSGDDRLALQAGFGFTGGINGGLGTDTLYIDGALTVDYNLLGLTGFEQVLFGAGGNATLEIGNAGGTVGVTISGFDQTTETIDLTGIGSNGQVTNHDTVNNRVTITGSLGSVTLQLDASDGTVFTTAPDGTGGTNFTIPCFCRGTLIRTESGEVPVEELAIGDHVTTLSGRSRPIRWIGRRAYNPRFVRGNPNILPVRVMAGALAAGVPSRDLWVSPEHALYIDGLFLPARHLINGVTVCQAGWAGDIEYFHIELDRHDVIFAEGAAAETFVAFGGRGMFQNGVEFAALYPRAAPPEWEPYEALLERAKAGLSGVRGRLLARAARLGRISRDPDLHLLVDGSLVQSRSVANGVHRFMVPGPADDVRIGSRSLVPAETEIGSFDRRRVGVPVRRIVLSGAGRRLEIAANSPLLRDGFHAHEGSHCWTDGHAHIPPQSLADFSGGLTIEIHVAPTELHYPVDPHGAASAALPGRAAEEPRQMRRAV